MTRNFEEVGRHAHEMTRRIGEIVPALAGLTGAASIAGLVELTERFSCTGAGIQRTAAVIGASATDLQRFQNAGEYAGISAETMAGSLGTLDTKINDAALGLAGSEGLIWASQKWNIALRNQDGSVRKSVDVLGDLADVYNSSANLRR